MLPVLSPFMAPFCI